MSAPQRSGQLLRVIQPLVAGLLAFTLYLNTLHGPFLFDDWTYIAENPLIRDFGHFLHPGTLQAHLTQKGINLPYADLFDSFVRRPLTYLTFALNYRLHGLDNFGYNLCNSLIHVAATLLVYLFTTLLVERLPGGIDPRRSAIPFLTTLLFACHPVQTQAVSYTNQRFASLAAMFFLLSLTTYLLSRRAASPAKRRAWYGTAILAAVCGMLSKENVFTLPVMLLLSDSLGSRERFRHRLPRLAPFLATLAIIPLAIALNGSADSVLTSPAGASPQPVPHLTYLFTQCRVLVTYLRLLVLPVNQQLDYDYPLYDSLFAPPVLAAALFLLALIAAGIFALCRGLKEERPLLTLGGFGIVWFFVTLSMESALVPLDDVIFEHRLYLPVVGIFLAVSAAGVRLYGACAIGRVRQTAAIAMAVAIIALLSVATVRRNSLWADAVSFSEDSVAKSPRKERVMIHLGDTYLRTGEAAKALAVYEKIPLTRETPQHVFTNMANASLRTGDFAKGLALYRQARDHDPNDFIPWCMLGILALQRGELDSARTMLDTALRLNRLDPLARKARAELLRRTGERAAAIADYEQLLTLTPEDTEAASALQVLRQADRSACR